MSDSLITQTAQAALAAAEEQPEQLPLFWLNEVSEIEPADQSSLPGEYTAERFHDRRPQAYQLCVQMLADPEISIRQICKALHITDGTVKRVRERETRMIENYKTEIIGMLSKGAHKALEQVTKKLPEANAKDAAISFGIMNQHRQLIMGEPTARTEVTAKVDFGAKLQELAAQATQILEMKRAQVVSVRDAEDETSNIQHPTPNIELLEAT